jgi:hypothetical protein
MAFPRCYLVYAVAPEGTTAREANDALNAYITDSPRGLPVFHDHFTGKPHGGVVVFEVRSQNEAERLADPGPLPGWDLTSHALTFALTGVGFAAQTGFTIEAYGRTSLEELRASEPDERRFWWRRRGAA